MRGRNGETRRLSPLTVRGRAFDWGSRTYIMGIINVTPDSFSGDGIGDNTLAAARQARAFAEAGCDIIDIGGESTRPGHTPVPEDEEVRRIIPALEAMRAGVDLPISVDTFKPAVAAAALQRGADMINCVWGAAPGIVRVAADAGAPLIVMHNRAGTDYAGDCVTEVISSLQRSASEAVAGGVPRERIIVDPGIGFGKTADHNVEILARLEEFVNALAYPLLVGPSRKSFLGRVTGLPVEQRDFATAAAVTIAIAGGADIVRVHDVAAITGVARVADAVCRAGGAVPYETPRDPAKPS